MASAAVPAELGGRFDLRQAVCCLGHAHASVYLEDFFHSMRHSLGDQSQALRGCHLVLRPCIHAGALCFVDVLARCRNKMRSLFVSGLHGCACKRKCHPWLEELLSQGVSSLMHALAHCDYS